MANVQTEAQISGLGMIVYCNDAPFDKALKAVLKQSDELISARNLAYARIEDTTYNKGKWVNSSLCINGSYVREGSLFVPNATNKRIWLRESLVLKNPSDAVRAHKTGREYGLNRFNIEANLEKIGNDNYLVLKDTSTVPTNRFGEDARTVWLFQDQAENYGKFLKNAGILSSNIYMYTGNDTGIDKQKKPFANQLWLEELGNDSYIGGFDKYLGYYDRVRGVHANTLKATRKNVERTKITSYLYSILGI